MKCSIPLLTLGLLFIFICSSCVSKQRYERLESKLDEKTSEVQSDEVKMKSLSENLESALSEQVQLENQNVWQAKLIQSLEEELEDEQKRLQELKDSTSMNLAGQVYFDSGQAHLGSAAQIELDQILDTLRMEPDKKILIFGHTDDVPIGSKLKQKFKTNWELSTARANSIRSYLATKGIPEDQMMIAGKSFYAPASSNATANGRHLNRRSELFLASDEQAWR